MTMQNWFGWVFGIALVGAAAYGLYVWQGNALTPEGGATTMGMLAEPNAIVVFEQRPSDTVTMSQVYFENKGFVVVHDRNADGSAGVVLGSSALLTAGEHDRVAVELSREAKHGETLIAMLHLDTDGDAWFDAAVDEPVQSILGGPIMGTFEISASANESIDVMI